MSDNIISLLSSYGPVFVFFVSVFAASGLPVPATLTLLVAGGLSAFGQLSIFVIIISAWLGTVIGDHLVRGCAVKVSDRFTGKRFEAAIKRADRLITRWGVLGIFGSRFIFPSILTPGVNYFCGLSRYPLKRFTPAVIGGEGVYVIGYAMLGRSFNAQLREIQSVAATGSLLLLIIVFAMWCVWILIKALIRTQKARF